MTVIQETDATRQSNGTVTTAVTTNNYAAPVYNPTTYAFEGFIGGYEGGVSDSHTSTSNNGGAATVSETQTFYDWADTLQIGSVTVTPNTASPSTSYTTNYSYDANNHLTSLSVGGVAPYTVSVIENAQGQIIKKTNSNGPAEQFFTLNGVRRGDVGNNGAPTSADDETQAIAQANAAVQTNGYAYGSAVAYADFDENYAPVNSNSTGQAQTPSSYTVAAGDTLESIAANLWGDSSLWYLIADANGLSAGQTLVAGATLSVPADVVNLHNNSSTFQVYNQAQTLGNVQPDQIHPPAKHDGCGIGQIIVAIIAVVVTAIVAPYAQEFVFGQLGDVLDGVTSVIGSAGADVVGDAAAGALAGAAGGIASQAVGLATGVQSKFSWTDLAAAAIAGGAFGGVGGFLPTPPSASLVTQIELGVERGALSSAISQGVDVATGLQHAFNWTSLATASIEGGVAAGAGYALNANHISYGTQLNKDLSGAAAGVVGAAARTLLTGQDFGTSLQQELPNIIGTTIGSAIANGIEQASQPAAQQQSPQAAQGGGSASGSGSDSAGVTLPAVILPDQNGVVTLPNGEVYGPSPGGGPSGVAPVPEGFSPVQVGATSVIGADTGVPQGDVTVTTSSTDSLYKKTVVIPVQGRSSAVYYAYWDGTTGTPLGAAFAEGGAAPVTLGDGVTTVSFPSTMVSADIVVTATRRPFINNPVTSLYYGVSDFLYGQGWTEAGKWTHALGTANGRLWGSFTQAAVSDARGAWDAVTHPVRTWNGVVAATGNAVSTVETVASGDFTPVVNGWNGLTQAASNGVDQFNLQVVQPLLSDDPETGLGNLFAGAGSVSGHTVGIALVTVATEGAGDLALAGLRSVGLLGDVAEDTEAILAEAKAVGGEEPVVVEGGPGGVPEEVVTAEGAVPEGLVGGAPAVVADAALADGAVVVEGAPGVGSLGELAPGEVLADGAVAPNVGEVDPVGPNTDPSAPGACFVAGTLIHTKSGLKPIEEIRVGDYVLSQPEATGEQAFRRVVDTFSFDEKAVLEIAYANLEHYPS